VIRSRKSQTTCTRGWGAQVSSDLQYLCVQILFSHNCFNCRITSLNCEKRLNWLIHRILSSLYRNDLSVFKFMTYFAANCSCFCLYHFLCRDDWWCIM